MQASRERGVAHVHARVDDGDDLASAGLGDLVGLHHDLGGQDVAVLRGAHGCHGVALGVGGTAGVGRGVGGTAEVGRGVGGTAEVGRGVGGTAEVGRGVGTAGALRVGGSVIAIVADLGLVIEEGALDTAHAADRIHRADGGAQREARKGVGILTRYLGRGIRIGRSHGRVNRGQGGGGVGAILELDDHIHDGRNVFFGRGRGILVEKGLAVGGGQRVVDVAHGELGSRFARRSLVSARLCGLCSVGVRAGLVEERPRHGQGRR